ncbi:fungal-specific transcription factor domain-containing protein [Zychaea mexicana]|uniref:fungal-specific transcription factor domain-containing protein n=1 Tax=Zychaea mexicana TaxID=64656 RepID=UPI0022FE6969|nr:fungal-specific transcription factor domain-containing protein [Zychaea mexicana]KAI9495010.1 fungal-specific transcription factor domain-containing protein [Zychaea mexicana]
MIEQLTDGLVRLTLHNDAPHLDDDNVTPWRNYGDFVRWSPEPSLPHYYTAPIDMPSRPIQEHLIHVFFSQCHPILPTISRSMFFDHLNVKGPLITPLLLNIMYAHAARHVQDSAVPGSHIFYNRARRLVDDFLDVPRVSTVIALLYMASYNNNEDPSNSNHMDHSRVHRSSRAWMYSGMAVRMCLELGLHTANYSSQMSQFDVELRKRVLWTCYVMDKLESCMTERPWMLRAKDIALDFPTPLPEDDVQERSVLEGFGQLCRLMILMERVIHFFAYDIKNRNNNANTNGSNTNGLWTLQEENQTLRLLDEVGQWRDSLPETLQWSPSHNNVPASSIVTNLHLVYYDLELSLVMCCRYQDERLHRERRRTLANTITHLVSLTIHHPHLMYTFGLTAFSAIFAALTHAADFEHPVIQIAEDAKLQFRKTLEDVRAIVEHVPIRDMRNFARLVDLTLQPPHATTSITDTTLPSIQQQHMSNRPATTTMAPFSTTAGLVPSPFATFDPSCLPSSSSTSAATMAQANKGASSGSVSSSTSATEPPKSIEPADYTFELISVADEWARTLMYQ